ncbi:MAG TPA: RNA polymerase sigma-70 factor [Puia sp.]|nr:RNA polymerase sigma-70 factor [Puia sp.]
MPDFKVYDEHDLLLRLAAGDEKALEEIYHHLWQPLFISSYNILKNKAVCEDIVQEIFLQLWAKRETLLIRESLNAYMHTAVKYQVFRHIKNNPSDIELFENVEERIAEPSPETHFRQKEINQIVNTVVDNLPDKCRTIYKLSREYQLSHKEIANQLHISTKTVENQLTIALRKLRSSLNRLAVFLFF